MKTSCFFKCLLSFFPSPYLIVSVRGLSPLCFSDGQNGILPFAWDAVPRESGVGELGAWRGFRGLPGDVAREVIL